MNLDNISIQVGNFQDIEPEISSDYDYICLIGVFEYGQAYINAPDPFQSLLDIMKKHLKKEGHIVIAIENRFGLKYWAGCREDHLGDYFSGIENYPNGGAVRTFTRKAMENILKKNGLENFSFYYPYPDYKFMTTLYSDAYLPKTGELANNLRNFDRDRLMLFDEKKVYDSIIKEGSFPDFSNSFLVVIGSELSVKYVKYSNDRQQEYQIRTEICSENYLGYQEQEYQTDPSMCHYVVRKSPLTIDASAHIRAIGTAYQQLRERFQGGEIRINRCRLVDVGDQLHDNMTEENILNGSTPVTNLKPYVELEYLEGRTLTELLDDCLEKNDMEEFMNLFRHYISVLDYHSDYPVADFDLVFSNIIVCQKDTRRPFEPIENAVWNLIDYEWTFGKQISTKELAFRAVYCYLLEDQKRNRLNLDEILKELEITDEEADEYRMQEQLFQKYVTGNMKSMAEIRDMIGFRYIYLEPYFKKENEQREKERVQIYEDYGEGYREESSYFVRDVQSDREERIIRIPITKNIRQVRIDPAMTYCMIRMISMKIDDREMMLEKNAALSTNGIKIGESNVYVFATPDPNLNLSFSELSKELSGLSQEMMLEVRWELTFLTKETAMEYQKANQPKRRFHL